jgi:hypothetical protein
MRRGAILCIALLGASMAGATDGVVLLRRYAAPEASQGAAVGPVHLYAIGNSTIARYDKRTGARINRWRGDAARFPHLNSCALLDHELACASSNFPQLPQRSAVEFFDAVTLAPLRTVALPAGRGSITWVDRHAGAWWVLFANYDGIGGEAARDHRHTLLVRFDERWRERQRWHLPDPVLQRLRPMSASGGGWGPDGQLYLTGHDRAELYVLRVPAQKAVLEHVRTIAIPPIDGQSIDWDETAPGVLYGIARRTGEVFALRVLPATGAAAVSPLTSLR